MDGEDRNESLAHQVRGVAFSRHLPEALHSRCNTALQVGPLSPSERVYVKGQAEQLARSRDSASSAVIIIIIIYNVLKIPDI